MQWVLNFDGIPYSQKDEIAHVGRALIAFAVRRNMTYLRSVKRAPSLYSSGVRFRREPWAGTGKEEIAGIPAVLRRKWGDCDDLVAWRVAELRIQGIDARPMIRWPKRNPNNKYHAMVRLPSGATDDPSARLGMRTTI